MVDGEKSEQGGRRYRVKQSSQPGYAASRAMQPAGHAASRAMQPAGHAASRAMQPAGPCSQPGHAASRPCSQPGHAASRAMQPAGHAASRPCKSCMSKPHHIPAGLMCTLPVLGLIEDGPLQTKTTAKVQTLKEAQPCHKHLFGIYYTHSRSRHE